MVPDSCIHCGEVLSLMERNRSECWSCQDKTSVTYSDDMTSDYPKRTIHDFIAYTKKGWKLGKEVI